MSKFNLSDAAKAVLLGEDSRSAFEANIAAKKAQRGGEKAPHGEVGADKLASSTVTGQQDVGMIGQSPEKSTEELPNYTKGTPSATPPGATPPVGSEKDGVGATKATGPQDTQGRSDLTYTDKPDATDYDSIRDRKKYSAPAQTFHANPGSKGVQTYGEEAYAEMKGKLQEDIDALLEGESLSEEFVQKATTIFEAAVMSRVEEAIEVIEQDLAEQFESAVEQVKEELSVKVDDYLTYFVEEWAKENQIAIESGLKAEIVEDFIGGLKGLFEEHYIDIPAEKVDVVEELANKVEELEASLNEQIQSSIEMKKEINEHKKIEAIYAASEGLTQTQVEKLKSLAEGTEFTTDEEFAQKLSTLKESYFKTEVKVASNSALDDEVQIEEEKKEKVSADPLMEQYAKSISKTLVK